MRDPRNTIILALLALTSTLTLSVSAQEPVAWGDDLVFHTFSIAAVDPRTGESGVAVTTRVPCVGNGVPWVRAGVGAVATQASTRVAYGPELLEMMSKGMTATAALQAAVAADEGAAHRQVGVIGLTAGSAQHTGSEANPWAGHRSGLNYVTQGNILVGPEVLAAVAASFEATEESGRHLADRLIEALAAGQIEGGDRRKGRLQSAAVVVADPREGRSRRPDGITVHVNVCEHPEPVAELRRIYDTISQTLGYRTIEQFRGSDVWQLRVILHALGYFRPDSEKLERDGSSDFLTQDVVSAVDAFRKDQGLSTAEDGSPAGLVDDPTVRRLWAALEAAGKAAAVRETLKEVVAVRR